jgi:hypothetical protein
MPGSNNIPALGIESFEVLKISSQEATLVEKSKGK